MIDYERIGLFLNRARTRALVEVGMRTAGHTLALLGLLFLALAVIAKLSGPAASWPYVAFGSVLACVASGIALGYFRPARMLADPVAIARLVGSRRPSLASDILSVVELQLARSGGAETSNEMAEAFCTTVADATRPRDAGDLRRSPVAACAAGHSARISVGDWTWHVDAVS
jgi:hypothetical protein